MKRVGIVLFIMVVVCLCGCGNKKTSNEIKINERASDVDASASSSASAKAETVNPSSDANSGGNNINSKEPTSTSKASVQQNNTSLIQAKNSGNYTVVIDAGHQRKGNSELEPIAPGASQTKPKVSQGTTGISTKVPEYKVTLQVAIKLRDLLKQKGYKVIMCRETHDVNMSNSQRAQVANNANADAFVRIHCNGADNQNIKGALTMCQTKNNQYCGNQYSMSKSLSSKVLKRLCEATGASSKGISETDTMSGINWCTVPVTIVEMGFMSNKEEDKLLVSDAYQNKLARGIANGVIEYLNAK